MEAGKLFSELVNRQPDQSGGILTGTAVSDSVDGTVMVQMDGSVVAQPGEDEVTLTVSADDFADGSYVLPSVPYAGSLTITDSESNELEEQDYELDGARLTIFALSSSPVDIAYQTQVQQQVTNDDFDGDRYSLASVTNLTVEEMDSEGAWNPATYTLDGNILTIAGIEHQAGIVEFSYIHDVSVVCEPGESVLPDSPDDVSVLGRNSSGVDVVVTDYALDGNVITLPTTYDAYTVDYPVTTTETWNVSDQYQDEPLEDSDDAADPAVATIGHNLQWPPSSVVSCTIDGTAATYALDDVNVVVDAPAVTERWFRLTYDAPVSLQVPASMFATGAFTLPSIPLGSVSTVRSGIVLENVVDDDQLAIASLVVDSPTYSISYTEQVEQDVVELPCTPYVAEGQFVEIAVVNGMPTVIGASGSGDVTMTLAGDAADAAAAAEEAAAAAQEIAEATGQHVWDYTDGLHVTQAEKDTFLTTPSGRNILMNALGILIRDALQYRTVVHDEGLTVYDGQGNAATNVVANILRDLITLGYPDDTHAEIDYHSLQLIDKEGDAYLHISDLRDSTGYATITETFTGDGTTTVFKVNFRTRGTDTTTVTVNGTAVDCTAFFYDVTLTSAPARSATVVVTYQTDSQYAKAYTLGMRRVNSNTGGNSAVIGRYATASGYVAQAFGEQTYATGDYSHAEGLLSSANGAASHAEGGFSGMLDGTQTIITGGNSNGIGSHAEGVATHANGIAAHCEGRDTFTSGNYSHAQNHGTEADGESQTALGKYNVADTISAVIIGNGTADDARSNALTVDWSGNVDAAGDVTAANLGGPYYSGDMDDLTTSGVYYVDASSTNVPAANYAGQCVVANSGDGFIVQLFTVTSANPSQYARRMNTGGWGSWALIGAPADETTFTPSNATATSILLHRARPNCTIYVDNLRVSSALASGSTLALGTLPSNYRPHHYMVVPLVCNNNNNLATGSWLAIGTGGGVTLYNRTGASIGTTNGLYGTTTYSI